MKKTSAQMIAFFIQRDWLCAGCGGTFPDTPQTTLERAAGNGDMWNAVGNHMTIDHILPLSKGGTWAWKNLQPMCYVCNNVKSNGDHKTNAPGTNAKRDAHNRAAREAKYARQASELHS